MSRPDISDRLIHFVRGDTREEGFVNLVRILDSGHIRGSNGHIRGGHTCVCFTEAPLDVSGMGLDNLYGGTSYQPFGLMFEKLHIYELGGRPVIYGPASDYEELPAGHNWRHVRYEPNAEPAIDWTWEREWRVNTERLDLDRAVIVVPEREFAHRLQLMHDENQDMQIAEYSLSIGELAAQYREGYPWRIEVLNDI